MYLSAFKVYEHKPPTAIRERVEKDHMSVMRAALTNIKKVNKTDVVTLKTTFGVRSTELFSISSCSTLNINLSHLLVCLAQQKRTL